MKLRDVILKAMAKKLRWTEAAEIAGMSVRIMQRMRQRYQQHGYTGLRRRKRGAHRRRPLPGMLLHIDGSKHRWFQDDRYYDLIVIL